METWPQLKVSSGRLEKPGIDHMNHGVHVYTGRAVYTRYHIGTYIYSIHWKLEKRARSGIDTIKYHT